MTIQVQNFFDSQTNTLTYVVHNKNEALIIDPVWNLDLATGTLSDESYLDVKNYLIEKNLDPLAVLETHVHADHISGSHLIKKDFPDCKIMIHENIKRVQEIFSKAFDFNQFMCDGSQFDHLFADDDLIEFSDNLNVKIIHTPGHTPACSSFLINDSHLFTGDALFMPDFGVGRCDFPDGSAEDLYKSIHDKLYQLDDHLQVYTGHDYMPGGRELRFTCLLKEQKEGNIHLKKSTSLKEFVEFRTKRDKELSAPRLLLPSLQVNMNAGEIYRSSQNELPHLKIPLKIKD